MKTLHIVAALGAFALAGCSGVDPSRNVPQTLRTEDAAGPLQPSDAADGLLYVSDSATSEVSSYKWPKTGGALGQLTGFDLHQAQLCNDGSNIYLANTFGLNVLVYPAGATSPSRTIADSVGYPEDCAFDSTTGNLAVTNTIDATYGSGNVALFKKAAGSPQTFSSPAFHTFYETEYDGRGNLFMDGEDANFDPVFGELPAGGKKIRTICPKLLQNGQFGGIGWDGKYLVVGGNGGVRRIKNCKVVGFTPLAGAEQVVQFEIIGKRLTAIDFGNAVVDIYAYPKGGTPIRTLANSFLSPIGLTIVSGVPPGGSAR
jgi:hypothetical protein